MDRALAAYRNGDRGIDSAARTYRRPKAILKWRIDGTNINEIRLSSIKFSKLWCVTTQRVPLCVGPFLPHGLSNFLLKLRADATMSLLLVLCLTSGFVTLFAPHKLQNPPFYFPLTCFEHLHKFDVYCLLWTCTSNLGYSQYAHCNQDTKIISSLFLVRLKSSTYSWQVWRVIVAPDNTQTHHNR
jgi:hypothetical protein